MQRLGICSWSLRPENPQELCDRVHRAGFSAVQLALTPVAEDPNRWGGAFAALRESGIVVLSGMLATHGEDYSTLESIARTGGLRPSEHWEANRARAERVAECAQANGVKLVTFHAGFLPHADGVDGSSSAAVDPGAAAAERAELLERLRIFADIFEARGVRLGLETGQERASTLVAALRELDHPNVGVNFDPANMILYGMGDPVDALRRLAPWVVQVHIKDAISTTVPGTWGREVTAGTGAVDWPAFFRAVRQLPASVDLVVEREAGAAREGDAALAAQLVQRHVPSLR